MPPADSPRPVLILGAGVNGASVARELALNGVPVWIVDVCDIAAGATSKSSRLIHGGLRYLEYGEFHLVRESLEERDRLRRLAPQFVEPLRLYIPVSRRFSGVATSALRFLGASRVGLFRGMAESLRSERGLWLVQFGLGLYDRFASNADFPPHTVVRAGDPRAPAVDPSRGPWLCAYSDGQMRYPERFTVALLHDAARAAAERDVEFRVFTHHDAHVNGNAIVLLRTVPPEEVDSDRLPLRVEPSLIVNATGAWGDFTLHELRIPVPPLFGGTKGSHFLTRKPSLIEALQGNGLYAEAGDGRLVFVLPFGDAVLVGTTDERFEDRPEQAVATRTELDYLLGMVNSFLPRAQLTRDDIEMHCCGVRPLPRETGATSAVSRDHAVIEHFAGENPVLTLVGGKLTTCRAFGESVADQVMTKLGVFRETSTHDRIVPGGEDYPRDADALEARLAAIGERFHLSPRQTRFLWSLFGTRTKNVLEESEVDSGPPGAAILDDTDVPLGVARWVIRHEWARTLDDLVERRLMLIWQRSLTTWTLRRLAGLLVEARLLPREGVEPAIAASLERLRIHYGRSLNLHRSDTHG